MQCVCAILSSVACSAVQYFSTLSNNWQDIREKIWKACFHFSLQLLSETFPIPRKIGRDMIRNVNWCSCNVRVIFVRA